MSDDDEDDDDVLASDPMAFIDRQASQQVDISNQFEDDPKAVARRNQRR